MEKSNSLINGYRGNNVRDCNSTGSSYGGGGGGGGGEDCRFSWPPRSYTCTFCQREFRSAQALGGHMNVHRRDRARLRRSSPPPILDLNLNLSPNPSFSKSPSSSPPPPPTRLLLPPLASTLSSLVSSPLSSLSSPSSAASPTDHRQMNKRWPGALGSAKMQNTPSSFGATTRADGDCIRLKKAAEFVRLDLEIGLPSSNPEEDLDLELRLGYYS